MTQAQAIAKALESAVTALYLDDSSDFRSALYEVVRALDPELEELLYSDPGAAHRRVSSTVEPEDIYLFDSAGLAYSRGERGILVHYPKRGENGERLFGAGFPIDLSAYEGQSLSPIMKERVDICRKLMLSRNI